MWYHIQRPSSYVVDINCEVDVNENNDSRSICHMTIINHIYGLKGAH
jgi:hypothetical protein